MPGKRKRKVSSSETDSTSSSSNSSSSSLTCTSKDCARKETKTKRLKKKLKELEAKLKSKTAHYEGKIESVAVFRGAAEDMTMQQWLRTIDSTGDLFDWDNKARIFCMVNRLRDNARNWYENQEDLNISWRCWKEKLLAAFPARVGLFPKLKEFVNKERAIHQDLVDFYYRKLALGQSCKLGDNIIVDVITSTINDPFIKSGIRAAGCVSTKELLKFLISNVEHAQTKDKREVMSDIGREKRRKYEELKKTEKLKCYLCGKEGHKNVNCEKFRSSLNCNYCKMKGHTDDNCYKQKRKKESNPIKINRVVCNEMDSSNEKFYKNVRVLGNTVSAYVDFGSGCNTIKSELVRKLNLQVTPVNGNIVIEGYGGATVIPTGIVTLDLEVDDLQTTTDFYVVQDHFQNTDVLIGRPITEDEGVVVYKDSRTLRLTRENFFDDWTLEDEV